MEPETHAPDSSIISIEWDCEDTSRKKYQVATSVCDDLHDLLDTQGKAGSKGKLVGEAITNFLNNDRLAEAEARTDRMLDAAGIKPPHTTHYNHPYHDEIEFINPTNLRSTNYQDYLQEVTQQVRPRIPDSQIDAVREKAVEIGGQRRQSYVINDALRVFFAMPFRDRFERLKTKQQLLARSMGLEIDDPTPFIERRMNREIAPKEAPEVRDYESLFEDDLELNELEYSSTVAIPLSEVDSADVRNGKRNRVPVLLAVMRHKKETTEKKAWHRSEIRDLCETLYPQVESAKTYRKYVDEALNHVKTGYTNEWVANIGDWCDSTVEAERGDFSAGRMSVEKTDTFLRQNYRGGIHEFTSADFLVQSFYQDKSDYREDVLYTIQNLGQIIDGQRNHFENHGEHEEIERRHAITLIDKLYETTPEEILDADDGSLRRQINSIVFNKFELGDEVSFSQTPNEA